MSAEELRAIARPEAEASAAALGARGVFMLGYTDGDLCDVQPSVLRGQLMRLIRELKADVIFSWDPFAPFEDHPDHRAVAWAASDAAAFAHFPLYHPEHLADGLEPHRVSEWYWYSRAVQFSLRLKPSQWKFRKKGVRGVRAHPAHTLFSASSDRGC